MNANELTANEVRRLLTYDKYSGVFTWREQKWFAQIKVDGKTKSLGHFDNIDDAVQARLEAEQVYGFTERHGELNLPNRFKSAVT